MTSQTQANRQWWDQRAREHERADFYDLDGFRAGRERLPAEQHGAVPFLFSLQAHRPVSNRSAHD